MFKNISIVNKIRLSYFVVFLFFIISSFVVGLNISNLNETISSLSNKNMPSISILKTIQVDITKVRKDEFSLLPNGKHPQINTWLKDLEQWRTDVQNGIAAYEALELSEHERASFQVFKATWNQYIQETRDYNKLLGNGDSEKANEIVLASFGTYTKALTSLDQTLELNDKLSAEMGLLAKEDSQKTQYSLMLSVALIVAIFIVSSILLSRVICRPIDIALNLASNIAKGKLDNTVKQEFLSKDELGTLLQQLMEMQSNLHTLVSEINDSTVQLTVAVEEVSAISSQTASGMQSQQLELSSVASAMTEMQAAVGEVAQNTEVGSMSASSATDLAKQGADSLQKTISVIDNVSTLIQESDVLAKELEESSNNINVVVDVIRGIAEQTNLLALNAAIEAARAGEQGRGFAVVADEVRSLAQRTQDSTSQIIDIVSVLQEKSGKIASSSENCQNGINQCVEQVNIAGKQISDIEQSVDHIAQMSLQIATACSEQNSVSEDLSRSVEQINTSSIEMTQGADQTAVACQQISNLAHNLKARTEVFQL